jgi:hypothetical protein
MSLQHAQSTRQSSSGIFVLLSKRVKCLGKLTIAM